MHRILDALPITTPFKDTQTFVRLNGFYVCDQVGSHISVGDTRSYIGGAFILGRLARKSYFPSLGRLKIRIGACVDVESDAVRMQAVVSTSRDWSTAIARRV